jgi:CHAT domain-containing protein
LVFVCTGDRLAFPAEQFERVRQLFQRGDLAASQEIAAEWAARYRTVSPEWSTKFSVLQAESAAWRGMSREVLRILTPELPSSADQNDRARRWSLLAAASIHLRHRDEALRYLAAADALCAPLEHPVCAHVLDAHATMAAERGKNEEAYGFYAQELTLARKYQDRFGEASALMNLAGTLLPEERFDEAIDGLNASNKVADSLDAEDIRLTNTGNLGWAYYSLGDRERAFALFQDAERRASALGDTQGTILWSTTAGYILQDSGDWARAEDSYRRALVLARQIGSNEDTINSLESLAHISIELNRVDEADGYLRQVDPLVQANRNRPDALDVILARGRIAAARRQDEVAERLFKEVDGDPESQITMRLGAEHAMARLYEAEGRKDDAQAEYVTALSTFESARDAIKTEASKLPYFANATPIYDDYIRLLLSEGRSEEALTAADQSRARTLEQGLGFEDNKAQRRDAGLQQPGAIAARAGATLLFYWLGEKQSWLWAITPRKTAVFPLPPKAEIARTVERYRQDLLGAEDPLRSGNENGRALYRMLVAPAKDLVAPGGRVVVLCDGVLSELNFETLLVDGAVLHYWIEDADVVSAPSLLMLARTHVSESREGVPRARLLLVGDAVSPGPDYPELPNAPVEMREIRKHFGPEEATVLARGRATAAAYLESEPQRFSYIDFVAHGVASRTDPLDSAIILSRTRPETQGAEDSFKLYAREIMQHRIDARLVTIAACYGGGTRSYAGEGLVGLSWAFLRAGAHNVVGALWEVSDASAPLLMDAMYQGLQDGLPPDAALRQAKLELLRGTDPGKGRFRRPFFWGSFQMYTGM